MVLIEITAENIITVRDTTGIGHEITSSTVLITLAVGWAAFLLSLFLNIVYYALHPSQVSLCSRKKHLIIFVLQVDLLSIRDKLVVAMFGYEINLLKCSVKGLDFD